MFSSTSLLVFTLAAIASARPLQHYRRAAQDFGSCGSPEIEFANGLDGRQQPAFIAADQNSFNHGSALNIGVIASFVCQQLSDKCKAGAATISTCATAQSAAAAKTGGASADAFNAAFGITTNFAAAPANGIVAAQGASGAAASGSANSGSAASDSAAAGSAAAQSGAAAPSAGASAANASAPAAAAASSTGSLTFGSCANPAIKFGPGFDGRKATEESFEPEDQTSIQHGSALNIDIITQATCDQLKDRCKASADALAACAKGQQAASAAAAGGAKADAFNAALDIKTNFATTPAAPDAGATQARAAANAATPSIGSCSNPDIAFGIFDGRKEDSFEPANLKDFNHGSALNINIITKFICDTFVNKCKANQAAINSCAAAQKAVNGLSGKAAADAFNAAVLKPAA